MSKTMANIHNQAAKAMRESETERQKLEEMDLFQGKNRETHDDAYLINAALVGLFLLIMAIVFFILSLKYASVIDNFVHSLISK
jgi:hypothetical protein